MDLYHSIGPLHKPRSVKIGFEDQVGGNLPSSYWQCRFHRSYFQKRGMNIYFSDGHEISSKGKTAHREVKLDCNHETPIYTESLKKKPGQRDTEKGPLGPNSVPGKQWPINQSAGRGIWHTAGSTISDPIICQVCRNSGSLLTRNWAWSLPMDPFPGLTDPGVLRVHVHVLPIV